MIARKSYAAHVVVSLFALALSACSGDDDVVKDPAAPPSDENDPRQVDPPVALAEGLAPTPPMGWNSWNAFHCDVDENGLTAENIKRTADVMVDQGMVAAGYQYLNIDDCWQEAERDEDNKVVVASNFPNGMQEIADYVHERGLKLGLYSDRGSETCGHRVGSRDHEEIDAQTYADWGVDYLKYDNCLTAEDEADGEGAADVRRARYERMRAALDATNREIVFSLCAWSFFEWGTEVGQLWRTTTDITPRWSSEDDSSGGNVLSIARANAQLAAYAGPNGWNDPDMLEVGNFPVIRGDAESRAHFSMWAIMSAPLIAGNKLFEMTEATRQVLTNEEVIAVNQDALGLQGVLLRTVGDLMIWTKPINEGGARAVAIVNTKLDATAEATIDWNEIGLRRGEAEVRDLWQHVDLGTFRNSFTTSVPAHDVVMLKVTGSEPTQPKGERYLSDLTWTYAANGLGPVERDKNTNTSAANDGMPLSLGGTAYAKGLGVSAPSKIHFRLAENCSTFHAEIGIDDTQADGGSVVFEVRADGELLFESGVVTGADAPLPVDVSVAGKRRLELLVTNAGDGSGKDRAGWGAARLDCAN